MKHLLRAAAWHAAQRRREAAPDRARRAWRDGYGHGVRDALDRVEACAGANVNPAAALRTWLLREVLG